MISRLIIFAALLCSVPASALDVERPAVKSFVARLAEEHGFVPRDVNAVLAQAQLQQAVLDAMSRPAERALMWYEYRDRFIIEQRLKEGIEFWERHRELLEQVAAKRGVPPEYLVAILGLETYYGRITGKYRVLDALTTLAFDYPPRSDYFTAELEQFFLLTREDALDPLTALGSYAGAMGPPQFMPRSIRAFAVDGDGDGKRDLWADWEDILSSIANYFLEHGWKSGEPVIVDARIDQSRAHDLDPRKLALNETVGSLRDKGVVFETTLAPDAPALLLAPDLPDSVFFRVGFNNFYVITRYNRSPLYAMAVHDLATELATRVFSDDAQG